MRRAAKSLGHALRGFVHALRHERNISLFLILHCIVLLGTYALEVYVLKSRDPHFLIFPWITLTMLGGMFFVTENLNTAIERLADTVDDIAKKRDGGHYHPGIRMTKDVAAAASLIALCTYLFWLAYLLLEMVQTPVLGG